MPESLFMGENALGETARCSPNYPQHSYDAKPVNGEVRACADLSPRAVEIDIYTSTTDSSLDTQVKQTLGAYKTLRRSIWKTVPDPNGTTTKRQDICTITYPNVTFIAWLPDSPDQYGARFATVSPITREWAKEGDAGVATAGASAA